MALALYWWVPKTKGEGLCVQLCSVLYIFLNTWARDLLLLLVLSVPYLYTSNIWVQSEMSLPTDVVQIIDGMDIWLVFKFCGIISVSMKFCVRTVLYLYLLLSSLNTNPFYGTAWGIIVSICFSISKWHQSARCAQTSSTCIIRPICKVPQSSNGCIPWSNSKCSCGFWTLATWDGSL